MRDCDAALLLDGNNTVTLLARGEARRMLHDFSVSHLSSVLAHNVAQAAQCRGAAGPARLDTIGLQADRAADTYTCLAPAQIVCVLHPKTNVPD